MWNWQKGTPDIALDADDFEDPLLGCEALK